MCITFCFGFFFLRLCSISMALRHKGFFVVHGNSKLPSNRNCFSYHLNGIGFVFWNLENIHSHLSFAQWCAPVPNDGDRTVA